MASVVVGAKLGKARVIFEPTDTKVKITYDIDVTEMEIQPKKRRLNVDDFYPPLDLWEDYPLPLVTFKGTYQRESKHSLEERLALAVLEGDKKTALILADEVQEWNQHTADGGASFTSREKLRDIIARQDMEIARLKERLEYYQSQDPKEYD